LEIVNLKYESFFTGKKPKNYFINYDFSLEELPVLKVNNTFHPKGEFIDILKEVFLIFAIHDPGFYFNSS
jgi:hypothetical protein